MSQPDERANDLFIRQIRPAACIATRVEGWTASDLLERAGLFLIVSALWGLVFYLAFSAV